MKINWFSPLPPLMSEIAHYAKRTIPILAEQTEVVVWADQGRIDPEIKKRFEVRRYTARRVDWKNLNDADATIYHIGNDARFHASIWEVSRRAPGIVVLHDTSLQHLFGGIFFQQRRDPSAYLRAMELCYGGDGRRAAQEYIDHPDKDSYILHLSAHYPLTESAIRGALAVLVHTKPAYDRLRQQQQSSVSVYAPLPYPALAPSAPLDEQHFEDQAERHTPSARRALRLIVFGYLSPNRRIEPLLRALAGLAERDRLRLDIYGKLWDAEHVGELIRSLDLTRNVKVHGFVPDDELDRALAASDLAVNLRFPTMGEASSSQLRIWSYALPTLVTDVDWYGTLPAEAVMHVRPEYEIEDIRQHLRTLLSDPARFKSIGAAGRELLARQHAPGSYVEAIMNLVEQMPALRCRAAAFGMAERAASRMTPWAETNPDPATSLLSSSAAQAILDLTASARKDL